MLCISGDKPIAKLEIVFQVQEGNDKSIDTPLITGIRCINTHAGAHTIGHVNDYPTIHHLRIPRHTQSMIAEKILTEHFWNPSTKLHSGNVDSMHYWPQIIWFLNIYMVTVKKKTDTIPKWKSTLFFTAMFVKLFINA